MQDEARKKLEAILSKREYEVYYEQSESWIRRLINKIFEWIEEMFSSLFPALEPNSSISSMILFLILIVFMILLCIVVIKAIERVNRKKKLYKHRPLQHKHELTWTVEQNLLEAEKWEKEGDYAKAIRHLFLALLLYFHEHGFLEAKIWKTNWEYYEELYRVDKNGAQFFHEIAQLFDRVTYGKKKVKLEEYHHFRNKVMNFLNNERINEFAEG